MTSPDDLPVTLSTQTTRRDFLKLATNALLYFSGLLGLAGLVRFLSYEPDPPPPARFEIGLADEYPRNSRTLLPAIPAVLVHDASGYHALSLVCSHLGCTVEVKSTDYACPCHGSRYDLSGNVTKGPASSPLPALRVELTNDGKLVVYKD
jgi:cytochrome b6-f complex iron-sulfur subunit